MWDLAWIWWLSHKSLDQPSVLNPITCKHRMAPESHSFLVTQVSALLSLWSALRSPKWVFSHQCALQTHFLYFLVLVPPCLATSFLPLLSYPFRMFSVGGGGHIGSQETTGMDMCDSFSILINSTTWMWMSFKDRVKKGFSLVNGHFLNETVLFPPQLYCCF